MNKNKDLNIGGKMMMTLFFNGRGPLLIKWMPKETTVNAGRYFDFQTQLHKNIKNRRKKKLNAGVILLHDNLRPHLANLTHSMLNTLHFKILSLRLTGNIFRG